MSENIKLSTLLERLQYTIHREFEDRSFWVSARAMNVKKYEGNRRCYLTLEENSNGNKVAEIRAVFWSNFYPEIEKFEKGTQQIFRDGVEIVCKVRVRFHQIYGLSLEVMELDVAHALGTLEMEFQQTLDKLVKENPNHIKVLDEMYFTSNSQLPLPTVIKRIALITARNSDGQRDFVQELKNNKHSYSFQVEEFLTTIQGDTAPANLLEQLQLVEKGKFDVVAMVRGGGSLSDFRPFNNYALALRVASFPIPILTGIGHDRNKSIVDMMARELKTPTKVATYLVDHNFEFENQLIQLKMAFQEAVDRQLQQAKENLNHARRIIKMASPDEIMKRGFALIKSEGKIITNPSLVKKDTEIETYLQDEIILSRVHEKIKNEKRNYLS